MTKVNQRLWYFEGSHSILPESVVSCSCYSWSGIKAGSTEYHRQLHHVMLDSEELVTVRCDQVEALRLTGKQAVVRLHDNEAG